MSDELSTIPKSPAITAPSGICQTPSGVLLVSCTDTHVVYAVHPLTGSTVRLVGDGLPANLPADGAPLAAAHAQLHTPSGIALSEAEQCLYVCEYQNHAVRKITLPKHMFVAVGKCGDSWLCVWVGDH